MSSSPTPSFNSLWLEYSGYGHGATSKPRYSPHHNGYNIGGCCGSAYYNRNCVPEKHMGIAVYPENVEVIYKLKPEKYLTEQVVTKNGTFNVSLRIAK